MRSNIRIIGVSEEVEKEQEIGNLFEKIMKENFPNLMKEIDMQVQEVQRIPNNMDAKGLTPRHITVKMPKVKDRADSYLRGVPIRLSAEFSKRNFAG